MKVLGSLLLGVVLAYACPKTVTQDVFVVKSADVKWVDAKNLLAWGGYFYLTRRATCSGEKPRRARGGWQSQSSSLLFRSSARSNLTCEISLGVDPCREPHLGSASRGTRARSLSALESARRRI